MVGCQDLEFRYDQKPILKDISFEARKGQIWTIYGDNGVGKTTLLRCLAGLHQPTHGKVFIEEDKGFDHKIAYLSVKLGLKTALSPILNANTILSLYGKSYDHAIPFLTKLGVDKALQDKPLSCLSSGQQKKVALAIMCAKNAHSWLLDEPFITLDDHARTAFMKLMNEHVWSGGIVLLTGHARPDFGLGFKLEPRKLS